MIRLTQFIFLNEGKEKEFLEFEEKVLPLLQKYNGKLHYRIRPDEHSHIYFEDEKPYEIHYVTFESEEDLMNYMNDSVRKRYSHLRDISVKHTILVKEEI